MPRSGLVIAPFSGNVTFYFVSRILPVLLRIDVTGAGGKFFPKRSLHNNIFGCGNSRGSCGLLQYARLIDGPCICVGFLLVSISIHFNANADL